MAQRIIVLEKDTIFLRELETGFGRFGASVEVVQDADASVARAKAEPTALVLLSADAMSAPGEAFLVCKRFKSDDELSKIPFVIMGGAQHSESFESHKKLKRRADEYVKLPVAFEELVNKLSPLVPLTAVNGSASAEASESLDVDSDIDAFADNAFDDLMFEEPAGPPAKAAAPAPAAPAPVIEAPKAVEAPKPVAAAPAKPAAAPAADEVARLKQQVEQLSGRLRSAEEAEKRSSVVPRTTVPPGAGVSSREYLEMREQLNRKDKELLALRDEISQRDRQLLDASDRSLELERAQALVHEDLAATQRLLDEAQGKIKAYETDREAVAKRLEDSKARLTRAEEKGKRLEDELDSLKTRHAAETGELKAAYERKISELESGVAAEVARMRSEHATQVSSLESAHASTVSGLESKHASELAAERSARENEVASLKTAHAASLESANSAHAQALEKQQQAADAALARAVADGENAKTQALAEAAQQHAQDVERKLAEAERAKTAALEGQRRELEAKHSAAAKDAEDKHGRELAILGRKLSEAEGKGAILEERVEELEVAKQELEKTLRATISGLEADVKARTDERNRAQNELSAARARISSLERTEAQQASRITTLEGDLSASEARGARQLAKMAADQELLERVRKALGIGVGLLEQQRQNMLEDA